MNEELFEYVKTRKAGGMYWGEIARSISINFGKTYSVSSLKNAFFEYKKKRQEVPLEKAAPKSINEIDLPEPLLTIVDMRRQNATYKQIVEATGLTYKDVRSLCETLIPENNAISLENKARYQREQTKVETMVKKAKRKKMKRWSDEEVEKLFYLRERDEATFEEIGAILQRSARSVSQKYYLARKDHTDIIPFEEVPETVTVISEPVEEPVVLETLIMEEEEAEKEYENTRCRWSYQDELDVLCNFYNLSVDEARERYKRPYYAIARRMEQINDTTEPHHPALLMEAARIIEARKDEVSEDPQMTRRERRRMARIERKAAKVQKRLDRLSVRYGVRFEEVKDGE